MPIRPERLIWVYGKSLDNQAAVQIEKANELLIGGWGDCNIECHATVDVNGISDRLWLFRLKSKDQQLATKFLKYLDKHIQGLQPLKLKRRSNLPTPLVARPIGEGHKLDIGLHIVNDKYNATLMLFFYWEGRYYNPPHLQLGEMLSFGDEAKRLWIEYACKCGRQRGCCEYGCFNCFQLDCDACGGTGWKDFVRWQAQGYRIDYSSGWPLAIVSPKY